MSCPPIDPDFARRPDWLPHALDVPTDRVLLVRRGEAEYREAGFLDDRSLKAQTPRAIVSWEEMGAALSPGLRRDAQFIFHIGHVGSTLISRLLGEVGGVFALREPALLRIFYQLLQPASPWDRPRAEARLASFVTLLSRVWAPDQRAMVKATSFTSEIAPQLVPAGSKALLLHVSPRSYVENILAGDASRRELAMLAPSRSGRLAARVGRSWTARGIGEQAAMAWACEMTSLASASEGLGDQRTGWCDFDHFLSSPGEELLRIATFFGHEPTRAEAEALVRGPLMRRYSKDLAYEYSPDLRREVLQESRSINAAEIAAAMRWLEVAARASPAIARCLP